MKILREYFKDKLVINHIVNSNLDEIDRPLDIISLLNKYFIHSIAIEKIKYFIEALIQFEGNLKVFQEFVSMVQNIDWSPNIDLNILIAYNELKLIFDNYYNWSTSDIKKVQNALSFLPDYHDLFSKYRFINSINFNFNYFKKTYYKHEHIEHYKNFINNFSHLKEANNSYIYFGFLSIIVLCVYKSSVRLQK